MNNPIASRGQKQCFASDILRVNKDDIKDNMKDGFNTYSLLSPPTQIMTLVVCFAHGTPVCQLTVLCL